MEARANGKKIVQVEGLGASLVGGGDFGTHVNGQL